MVVSLILHVIPASMPAVRNASLIVAMLCWAEPPATWLAQHLVTLFIAASRGCGDHKPQVSTWSRQGGCYAKCIGLDAEKEPEIFGAIRFGAILENVVFDEYTREVDYMSKCAVE